MMIPHLWLASSMVSSSSASWQVRVNTGSTDTCSTSGCRGLFSVR
uniref:Uncharacterized protein n=1 Tax=Arundo donax TaxID=35708 RepID=A0A0A8YAY3_ARUDO